MATLKRPPTTLVSSKKGDSLHVNQAYNKYVSVLDKSANKESLAILRNKTLQNKGVVNPWDIIHVV